MTGKHCTPCRNFLDDYLPPLKYKPSLDSDETCVRCGCTQEQELDHMGLQ